MEATFTQLLIFGLLAVAANVAGGLVLFPSRLHSRYRNALRFILALGAGFMLSVSFIEVLPRSIDLWSDGAQAGGFSFEMPMLLVLVGYMITQFFEHTIAPHFHLGEEVHAENLISTRSAYTATAGLMIHCFFDGIAIASAAHLDVRIGLLVFIAVFLHKLPEGFTIGSMMIAAGRGFRHVIGSTTLIGLTTLIGVMSFYLLGRESGFTVAYALPIACGVSIYVAASDLIPEVNHHGGKKPLVSLFVFLGVALFFGLHYLLHSAAAI